MSRFSSDQHTSYQPSAESGSELDISNFKRINLLNWVMALPLIILFAWPYYYVTSLLELQQFIAVLGSLMFSLPFTFTIIHGHVTMALGSMHRHHFYDWLNRYPLSYGFFFHPLFIKTRFRLIVLLISFSILPLGYFFP